jgi:hypothetical protein
MPCPCPWHYKCCRARASSSFSISMLAGLALPSPVPRCAFPVRLPSLPLSRSLFVLSGCCPITVFASLLGSSCASCSPTGARASISWSLSLSLALTEWLKLRWWADPFFGALGFLHVALLLNMFFLLSFPLFCGAALCSSSLSLRMRVIWSVSSGGCRKRVN